MKWKQKWLIMDRVASGMLPTYNKRHAHVGNGEYQGSPTIMPWLSSHHLGVFSWKHIDCYSVPRFTSSYAHVIPGLTDISQWPKEDHGFFLYPPILRRFAGRPKNQRYKSARECKGRNGRHQYPICKRYGHRWHNCKDAAPEAKEAYALLAKQRPKRKKTTIPAGFASVVGSNKFASMVIVPSVDANTPPLAKVKCKRKRTACVPDIVPMGTKSKKRLLE